jgi:predicted metal-binding membrane protein
MITWSRQSHTWIAGAGFIAAVVACWAWIVPMAIDMYGAMTGPSAWMMTTNWDFTHLVLLFAMWVVMMAGMMLPSAVPALLRYAMVIRQGPATARASSHVSAFAGGYLVVWTGFSLLATILQRSFGHLLWLNPMMEPGSRGFGAALLVIAGIYQFTPWKRSCLESCRTSAQSIRGATELGVSSGFRFGLVHGLKCLGCCWALMLLLFVGGVMNLWCIVALTIFVLVEKIAPFGAQSRWFSGVILIALGVWYLGAS